MNRVHETPSTTTEPIRPARHAALPHPLRVVTSASSLNPDGGIEICTFEDSLTLRAAGHDVEILFARSGTMRADYEANGVSVDGPFGFGFSPRTALADFARFLRAVRHVRRSGADVLWLTRPEAIVWGQFVSRLAGIPLVVHLHHAPNYRRLRLATRGVSQFIAVSEYMAEQWIARGVRADRVTVVHNAVPLDHYRFGGAVEKTTARGMLGIAPGKRVVTYYGRIAQSKGILTLLAAWKKLALTDAVLLLVGAWPDDDPEIRAAFDALPEGSAVFLPAQDDVVPLLHASDLVVAPSWEPESFGRTVVEAMATGRPAIGSRVGGSVEVLSGGMDEFLVRPGDEDGLASAISEHLNWDETDPTLGLRSRAWIEKRFPPATHAASLERILVESRDRGRRRRPTPVDHRLQEASSSHAQ